MVFAEGREMLTSIKKILHTRGIEFLFPAKLNIVLAYVGQTFLREEFGEQRETPRCPKVNRNSKVRR